MNHNIEPSLRQFAERAGHADIDRIDRKRFAPQTLGGFRRSRHSAHPETASQEMPGKRKPKITASDNKHCFWQGPKASSFYLPRAKAFSPKTSKFQQTNRPTGDRSKCPYLKKGKEG